MNDRETMLGIAHTIIEASKADQTEVIVMAGDEGLTRFASNAIHQNVTESALQVQVRAVIGKQIGVATGNDPSPGALKDLAARAYELACFVAPNEEFVSLPGPPPTVPECDLAPVPATVACGPEERAASVRELVQIAERYKLSAAGQVTTGQGATAVANSLGVESFYHKSSARVRVVMQGPDSSGFAEANSDDVSALSARALGATAADKAVMSAGPREVEPGAWTVILEPLAVEDMITTLAVYDMHALPHQEGRSFTTGHLGEKVCGDNITLWDDGWDPRGARRPFDYEGIPRQKVMLIEDGVLKGVTYDSFTAGREPGARNTGHALPAPNTFGPAPINLFLKPGESTVAEMIAATERGILVTRFHYTNMIHPVRTVFTGMTRDGTFLIENGQVVGGIKNMRFTQSILEALSNVDMIGREGVQVDNAWVPALRVQGFNFSSGTRF
jgi:PmbA protein